MSGRGTGPAGYAVRPIPGNRLVVIDRLAGASRRFQVHALVELDVTVASARLAASVERVSWTGFVIATLARAVEGHPEVNARRAGRRMLYFDRVDIGATVERRWDGHAMLDVVSILDADHKSCAEITEELRRAKESPPAPPSDSGLVARVARLPAPLRRRVLGAAARQPAVSATFGPAVGVTSIGMFSTSWGWAVPLAPLTVTATVGGIAERPVVRDGELAVRTLLPLTLSFDHAVVDGAPAARFLETLRGLCESAAALDALDAGALDSLGEATRPAP